MRPGTRGIRGAVFSGALIVLIAMTALSARGQTIDGYEQAGAGRSDRGGGSGCPARVRLGVIGDSLSDEYSAYSYTYAQSWTQLLASYGADIGPTAVANGISTWGPPRGLGMQSNWSLGGAQTRDAVRSQITGLVADQRTSRVTHAVVFVGLNDWASWFQIQGWGWWYVRVTSGQVLGDELARYADDQIRAYDLILAELNRMGVQTVLCTVPDFSICPHTWGAFASVEGAARWRAALDQLQGRLLALADRHDVAVLDVRGLLQSVFGTPENFRTQLEIAGATIQLRARNTTFGQSPTAAWTHDGLHPGSVVQGILAMGIARALNRSFGTCVAAPSEAEVVRDGWLTPGPGGASLESQIGSLDSYVRLPLSVRSRPDRTGDGRVNVSDLMSYLADWFASGPSADVNGDGVINVADLFAYLQVWFAGQ